MDKLLGKSYNIEDLANDNRAVKAILEDMSIGHNDAARKIKKLGFSIVESTVRSYRKKSGLGKLTKPLISKSKSANQVDDETFVSIVGDEGELSVGKGIIPVELKDNFDDLLIFFGLSPESFEVIDDSVKVSKWQTSKRTESGDRDVIWLWSYKARFVRKSEETLAALLDLEDAVLRAHKRGVHKLPRRTLGAGLGEPVTYAHVQGDEQSGKSEGGGLAGLQEREEQVLENSLSLIQHHLKKGVNIECILDSINGDRIENIFGHYPSQARTSSTLRSQLDFATDMDIARTEAFAQLGIPIKKVYTPSNHGEIRQVIGQSPYTSESDNLDLIIAEMVQKVISRLPIADQIEWHIPHDDYITRFITSGVPVGVTHGHKIRGKVKDWVMDQTHLSMRHHNFDMRIVLMGHFHHFYAEEVSGTTVIMTPTLDGGSPYFEAGSGERSNHGALGLLIGNSFSFGWSDIVPI